MSGTLALDISNKTGFAHSSGYSGVWNLRPSKGDINRRLVVLKACLVRVHTDIGIDRIVIESAFANPKMLRTVMVLKELHGVVKLFCLENYIPCFEVSPSEIKKYATGKGNANKEMMVAAAAKFGVRLIDDNHSDALHLLDYAENVLFAEDAA